jgi:hypothetical protein
MYSQEYSKGFSLFVPSAYRFNQSTSTSNKNMSTLCPVLGMKEKKLTKQ